MEWQATTLFMNDPTAFASVTACSICEAARATPSTTHDPPVPRLSSRLSLSQESIQPLPEYKYIYIKIYTIPTPPSKPSPRPFHPSHEARPLQSPPPRPPRPPTRDPAAPAAASPPSPSLDKTSPAQPDATSAARTRSPLARVRLSLPTHF